MLKMTEVSSFRVRPSMVLVGMCMESVMRLKVRDRPEDESLIILRVWIVTKANI